MADISFIPVVFDARTFKVPDQGIRKLRVPVLYMSIYSNIPYKDNKNCDLSSFNKVVKHCIADDRLLEPLTTAVFTMPKRDKSGTGTNFLVEWMADQPVDEPLIEYVMKDRSGNFGLSFLGLGKEIREVQ